MSTEFVKCDGKSYHRTEILGATNRWIARRKRLVVLGIEQGVISKEQAIEAHNLSLTELESWSRQNREGKFAPPPVKARRKRGSRVAKAA